MLGFAGGLAGLALAYGGLLCCSRWRRRICRALRIFRSTRTRADVHAGCFSLFAGLLFGAIPVVP